MRPTSAKPQAMKKINTSLIIKQLKKMGSATKAELAEATGISATTIRSILAELVEENEVISLGLDESSGGRRAERYEINLNNRLALAVYLNNNNINYCISNSIGEIIEDRDVNSNCENYYEAIDDFLEKMLGKNKSIRAVSVGVPGVVEEGSYYAGKMLNDWREFNIGAKVEQKYNIPVILENDLNAISLGYSLNLMRKLHVDDLDILNMIYIHFTKAGAGAGIISNGKLVRGSRNFAGELGFLPMDHGQHLNYILSNKLDDDTYVDIVSRVIATVNCIINPDFVVIGGEIFKFDLQENIALKCNQYIANNIKPDIYFSKDSRNDYLTGLTHVSLETMNSEIKLIDNTRIK